MVAQQKKERNVENNGARVRLRLLQNWPEKPCLPGQVGPRSGRSSREKTVTM